MLDIVINPTEGCEPLDVTFPDTSIYTSSLDTIVSVEWFFGNGNSFIQTTAPFVYNYRYDNYGTYVVYNVVTMASGCLDTSAQLLSMYIQLLMQISQFHK